MSLPKLPSISLLFATLLVHASLAWANPAREEALRLRTQGYTFQSQGDLMNALSAYQKAIELDPTYATPHNDLGVILEEQGKLGEAEQSYKQALKLNPAYTEAHANMAMLYERTGDQEKAIYHWLKRYQLGEAQNPGTLRAKERLQAMGAFTRTERVASAEADLSQSASKEVVSEAASAKAMPQGKKADADKAAPKAAEPEKDATAKKDEPAKKADAAKTALVTDKIAPEAPAQPPVAPIAPKETNPLVLGFMSLNEGIEITNMPMVRLKLAPQGVPDLDVSKIKTVQYSNDGKSYSSPEPLAAAKPWLLTPGDGLKTVYVQLSDNEGKPLARLYDTITLDTTPLTIYVGSSQGAAREHLMKQAFETHNQSEREFHAMTGEQGGWP